MAETRFPCTLNVRLPDTLAAQLAARAKAELTTPSEIVRQAIRRAVSGGVSTAGHNQRNRPRPA